MMYLGIALAFGCAFFVAAFVFNWIVDKLMQQPPIRVPDTQHYGQRIRNLKP